MSILLCIDHAVLQPTQTDADVREACAFCRELGTASVCVKPSMVGLAAELLAGSAVLPSTVVGFPHGGAATRVKAIEAELAVADGAREIDMVVNLGWVFAQEWRRVAGDIQAVVDASRAGGALTKVIFETGLLTRDEWKIELCRISERAGAAFVKTSTGFGFAKDASGALGATGAVERDVALMRAHCAPHVGVKASGGIRTLADAKRMIAAGATRLGTSATREIASGEQGASRSPSSTNAISY